MVQTVKQIMTKNPDNVWLAMLIFKATQIPNINKSPSELLNARKFRTNLPSIDINQGMNKPEIEMLVDKHLCKKIMIQAKSFPNWTWEPLYCMIRIQTLAK